MTIRLSPHALTEPRQRAYEIKRRNFQAAQGRNVTRMDKNVRDQGDKTRGDV